MNKLFLATCICTLTGCTSIQSDRGSHISESLVAERSALESVSIAGPQGNQQTSVLLPKPLDADEVVQVALLNNPRMRMLYAELGLAQADIYDATRLANPSIGFSQLSADGMIAKTTLGISQRVTELLFLHFNSKMARSDVLQAQQRVAHEVLSLEADVRDAYYQYVTARMIATLNAQITEAATVNSQYAESLYAAGNINQLQLNREQSAAAELSVEQHNKEIMAENKYSALLNLMGLQRDAVQLDERLPLPTEHHFDLSTLQGRALTQRLDIAATREALKTAQQQLQHTRHWHWLGGAEVGVEREHDKNDAAATGPAVSLDIPLFNQGGGAVMRRRATAETLAANLANIELSTRNNIVSQLAALTHAKQVVDQYQQSLVPLHDQVVVLSQQRFNYMLVGAPDVLLAKQQALNAHQQYLQSVGDYWRAYVELQRTVGEKLPGDDVATNTFIQLDEMKTDASSQSTTNHRD